MERRDIEIFLAVAEELHFGRAAERLRVSTARVSQTIKRLERRLGVLLFERTSRRVALTPVGQRLYDDIRLGYDQIVEGVRRAETAGRSVAGVLRAGFIGAPGGPFILAVTQMMRHRHPDVEVRIREVQFSEVHKPLYSGEIDILLCSRPIEEPDLTVGPVLIRESHALAVSSRHPFARRTSVHLDDLARDTVLRSPRSIPAYWDEHHIPTRTPTGRPIERGESTETIQELIALVGAGRGIYPVPAHAAAYYARPDVAYVPIIDAPPYEWGFVWRPAAETARLRAFHQAALTHAHRRPDDGWGVT
ncbi:MULTISPECIES: LysR family transcriptional regulator [unclassified Streptomyces]|uniref:LysR family transcriptional regulator n=1 Tax=unclassified Streptomyces TaxID=2593676 RepID=UPI000DB9EA0E|nr:MULTISPECIES: LysR family transcriptional regulator [unclassified Streptomyces]MYT69632.1 LysR family transcriptional regulator [Streptomyces sp. SID8367]RAJ70696.1 DNA-binding transcriptional LysR family regulator [Streptomyces sp. PsTaAH-137]